MSLPPPPPPTAPKVPQASEHHRPSTPSTIESVKQLSLQDQIKLKKKTEKQDTEECSNVDPDLPTVPINLFACGSGSYGRLAQGPNNEQDVPILSQCRSFTAVLFASIVCGAGHTLALDTTGRVWSWGKCHFGQLGHGKAWKDERLPKPIEALSEEMELIGAGWSFSMAMSKTNRLYTFGCGYYGALGNDSEETQATPIHISLLFPQGVRATKLCGGSGHAGIVFSDGSALVWGANTKFQLGLGDHLHRRHPLPLRIIDNNGVCLRIRDVAMGEAITVVVSECGKVFWCGEELHKTPTAVVPQVRTDTPAENVRIVRCECTAAGVLLLDADGFIYFTFELKRAPPVRITNWPTKNGIEPRIASIACGQNHGMGISTAGEVYSWGRGLAENFVLKLGRGQQPSVSPEYPDRMIATGALETRKPILAGGGSNHSYVLVQP